MHRRLFLGIGAGAAAVTATGACGTLGTPPLWTGDDANPVRAIDEIERRVEAASAWRLDLSEVPRKSATPPLEITAERYDLVRKGARSMALIGALHELSPGLRAHPDIQSRVFSAVPEMDEAVLGTRAALLQLRPDHHLDIRQRFQASPGLAMEIGSAIVDSARAIGTAWPGRARVRGLATAAAWRLDHESPAVLISDFDDKVRRLARARSVTAPLQRELQARIGEEAFWAHQQRLAAMGPLDEDRRVAGWKNGKYYKDYNDDETNDDSGMSTGTTVGLVLLGGAVLLGIIAGATANAGVGTVAALFLLIGLIVIAAA